MEKIQDMSNLSLYLMQKPLTYNMNNFVRSIWMFQDIYTSYISLQNVESEVDNNISMDIWNMIDECVGKYLPKHNHDVMYESRIKKSLYTFHTHGLIST